MTDPKRAQAGPVSGPAASNPEVELPGQPNDYQFPSRKARRHAELTGMIPIIVPKTAVPNATVPKTAVPQGPATAGQKDGTLDGGTDSSKAPTDTLVAEAPAAAVDAVPAKTAPILPARVEAGATATHPGFESEADDEAGDEAEIDELSELAPRPVSALAVTGLPVVPLTHAPLAAMPDEATAAKAPRTPKAGRDLPAAIAVGVTLLLVVIGSLLFYPLAFVAVATAFACVGVWEVTRAVAGKGIKAPMTPVMIGALAMPASAYFAGPEGLLFALVASAGATVLWRSLDPEPGAVKSILSGVFALMWIPFLLSFVFLMMRGENGPVLGLTTDLSAINPGVIQVIIMLLLVVANDTFGYLVGVMFGKHPMAPKISPKKSWEGFAGSLGGATLVAIPATVFLLDQHWWVGFALAIGMVFAGTGGDFAESMVKRELGIKDMSNLLPGHGGVMDRLDSILFAAPVAYATFSVLGQF
ncbi:phosphatidate cytidylyltransferase [Arthrobacter glacialis]|nr:phosphatidate cytidylyltransferase [Arthrobacter glacialis]